MKKTIILFVMFLSFIYGFCQSFNFKLCSPIIRSECDVPAYILPNVLECFNGTLVKSVREWENRRKQELINLFSTYMYGEIPHNICDQRWELLFVENDALNGRALRKDVRIFPLKSDSLYKFDVQIYLPKSSSITPVPLFLALSFHPNYTVCNDNSIKISELANTYGEKEESIKKGYKADFWNLEKILERGYGLATFCYQDLVKDSMDDFLKGFPSLFYTPGQHFPNPNEWGMISLWAWQMSRVMDYLVEDENIDKKRIIALGHSRLGKAALWAAAQDERFAMAVSNNSGCGGAAISRRNFGETIEAINQRFPHWFCGNFKQFSNRERYMPFDQHELIALIAPRPVYIASAEDDWWSDPKGEFLGGKAASPVYHLYSLDGLECEDIPPVEEPCQTGFIGYHIRKGKHDMTAYDVEHYLDFADKHLKTKP